MMVIGLLVLEMVVEVILIMICNKRSPDWIDLQIFDYLCRVTQGKKRHHNQGGEAFNP